MKTYKLQFEFLNKWNNIQDKEGNDIELIYWSNAIAVAELYMISSKTNVRIVDSEGNYHSI